MADNEKSDCYGNFQDQSGRLYQTPDNKPPSHGTPVTIYDGSGGSKQGTWSGGHATENKN